MRVTPSRPNSKRRPGRIRFWFRYYFDDKENFLTLLGKAISLVGSWVPDLVSRNPKKHWRQAGAQLLAWRAMLWALGLAMIAVYFRWLASYWPGPILWSFMLLLLYAWPPVTIGLLAFFQRLIRGGSTKRNPGGAILELPVFDRSSLPYRLRQAFAIREWPLDKPRANAIGNFLWHALSFFPTLLAMVMPIWWMQLVHASHFGICDFVKQAPLSALALLGVFVLYTIFFAGSELVGHWRDALKKTRVLEAKTSLPGQRKA